MNVMGTAHYEAFTFHLPVGPSIVSLVGIHEGLSDRETF